MKRTEPGDGEEISKLRQLNLKGSSQKPKLAGILLIKQTITHLLFKTNLQFLYLKNIVFTGKADLQREEGAGRDVWEHRKRLWLSYGHSGYLRSESTDRRSSSLSLLLSVYQIFP